MSDYFMNQCQLQKGQSKTTSWIPSKFAIKGKFVKLKNKQNEWVNGWKVMFVFQPPVSSVYVLDRSEDYKRTRKASDV